MRVKMNSYLFYKYISSKCKKKDTAYDAKRMQLVWYYNHITHNYKLRKSTIMSSVVCGLQKSIPI